MKILFFGDSITDETARATVLPELYSDDDVHPALAGALLIAQEWFSLFHEKIAQ